ncbi:GNAT family N-acetyltransferase [Hoeflea prorocentri]|uniref:GNAT family N-acetyltransferase n=1 Tax=Hoeflea prorocentri TaxID=1922333 RepID=A0A9X3UJU7_9HYPH|nr:GNAT family N-acetyltransferase [Hoeflea prorocentri]MCY6382135.1 GNAT family N-acetyltransferase [Hoeflea prorocentri]MDA5399935.1 GNAT family N-acetyltransferase [Hoeflea prorocentri]
MITLLTVNPAIHRNMIAAWMESDHVSKWWGDPARGLEHFDAAGPGNHAMIARDDTPIGYVRWGTIDAEAVASVGLKGIPADTIDVDIFIGTADETSRGAGSAALDAVFSRLQDETDAPLVCLSSSVENKRAHAAFRKAGCKVFADYDDPTYGPCHVFIRHLR